MRPKTVGTPYPLHRTDADPGRLGHGRAGPVAGRRRRFGQRHGHHTFDHFRAQWRDARWSRFIAPKPHSTLLSEPLLPAPDPRLGLAGRLHDLGSAVTIGRQKNDLCSPNVLLRAVAVSHHRFKLAAVGGAQSNVPALVHSSDSHVRVRQGNPPANRNVRFGPLDVLLEDVPRVRTPSGGVHFYFKANASYQVRNSAGRLATGVDVRADGGFVIVAGATRADGVAYTPLHPDMLDDF